MKRRLLDWLWLRLARFKLALDQRAPTLHLQAVKPKRTQASRAVAVSQPKEEGYHACLIPYQWLSQPGTSWECPVCTAVYSHLPTRQTDYTTEPNLARSSGENPRHAINMFTVIDNRLCYIDGTPVIRRRLSQFAWRP